MCQALHHQAYDDIHRDHGRDAHHDHAHHDLVVIHLHPHPHTHPHPHPHPQPQPHLIHIRLQFHLPFWNQVLG